MKKPHNKEDVRLIVVTILVIMMSVMLYMDWRKQLKQSSEVEFIHTSVYANTTQETEPIVLVDKPDEILIQTEEQTIQEDPNEIINTYVSEICEMYEIEPELIMSIIYHESRYNQNATNGQCLGLMQVSTRWHKDRAIKLGVNNFYDSHSNILLGVDYLSELFDKYKDPRLVLMLYNMNSETAFKLYREGKTSNYAKSVLAMVDELKKGE